jgi:nitrogen fixation NifU-like protein
MSGAGDLYAGLLRAHYEAPHNHGPMQGAGAVGKATNPLCGDEVVVYLKMEGRRVAAVGFDGHVCAVGKASASMMTDAATGRTAAQLTRLGACVETMLRGNGATQLGTLEALRVVRRYAMRVRCALLPWEALRAACDAWEDRQRGSA